MSFLGVAAMMLLSILICMINAAAPPPASSSSLTVPLVSNGRSFRALTENYIIYANTSGAANELRKWLDDGLDEFEHLYGARVEQRIIYIAIESIDGPDPWIATLPEKHDPNHMYALTPYAYFHEATCIQNPTASGNKSDSNVALSVSSICFIPTSSYFDCSFDSTLKWLEAARDEEIKKVPLTVRALSAPAMPLIYLEGMIFMPKIKKIDHQLMLLQRRQVVWLNWIDCAFAGDEVRRVKERQQLLGAIDKEWWDKMAKRPQD